MKNNPHKKRTTLRPTKKETIELERYKREFEAERIRREEIEKRLKESEERYRSIIENIEDGYFEVDLRGNFTFFNDSLCRMLGYSREELMGMNNRQYMDEENARKLYQAFNKVYRNGEPTKAFDWEVIRKDGTKRWGEASISLKRDSKGQAIGFRGIARDITERKKTEEALAKSEENYRSIFDHAVVGIYRSTLEGRFIKVNSAMARIFGYESPEEMITHINDITHQFYVDPALRQTFIHFLEKEDGKVIGLEYKAYRKDGSIIWIKDSARAVRGKDGATLFLEGFIEDITVKKHIEETLHAEKERFRSLSESAPFGMAMIDKEGKFIHINLKFKELFGYDLTEIPDGRTWFRKAYPDPEYRHQVIATWLKDVANAKAGEKRPRVFRAKCKDGSEKVINFITVQLATGEYLMACEDITEFKRAEEALRESEEQIRQLQKMEAIGRLAGGVAHDFNNLLTIIKGYSQLSLLELKESNPLKSNLEEILKATERASNLTRQLLAFSRRQILEPRVLNLNLLIQDLNKMLHRVLGEDVELIYHLAPDLWKVKIDPGQIEQVILNLAVNAREAMPSGGKLTIETSNVQLHETSLQSHHEIIPGPYIMLAVSDNGIGMSPEIQEHIFEPFFTTKEKGTGLGLSTVYGIVKQSGGYIYVYSELGQGTTFKIYLPGIEEKEDSSLIKNEFSLPLQGNETVLVVEDEPALRELMVRLLKDRGYQVLSASNGEETLKMFQEDLGRKVDLLVTDVVMPSMSGKQLADLLKKSFPGLRTLFISGYTDNAIVHHSVLIEGVDFLQKPFGPETLARKVREVLDRDRLIPILKEQKEI